MSNDTHIIILQDVVKYYARDIAAVNRLNLTINKGEILGLAGESGSGKTTLLRLIAGLETPDRGEISIKEELVAGRGKFVESQDRSVGLVFQDYALFPHMKVRDNIIFGIHKWPLETRKFRLQEIISLTNLQGLENRYPHQLSGGQQQRVALARALAPQPEIILLDEPFSNLDARLKDQVRIDIKKIIKNVGLTAVLVTHDIQDALCTADRIALLKAGEVQQVDLGERLYNYPANPYVASFFGKVNLLKAEYKSGVIQTKITPIPVKSAPQYSRGLLCLRPGQIHIGEGGIVGEVITHEFLGDKLLYQIRVGNHQLWSSSTDTDLQPGQQVRINIHLEHPHLMPLMEG